MGGPGEKTSVVPGVGPGFLVSLCLPTVSFSRASQCLALGWDRLARAGWSWVFRCAQVSSLTKPQQVRLWMTGPSEGSSLWLRTECSSVFPDGSFSAHPARNTKGFFSDSPCKNMKVKTLQSGKALCDGPFWSLDSDRPHRPSTQSLQRFQSSDVHEGFCSHKLWRCAPLSVFLILGTAVCTVTFLLYGSKESAFRGGLFVFLPVRTE